MAENHGLADGQNTIDIGNCLVFLFVAITADVVLFDIVQRFLLTTQPANTKLVRVSVFVTNLRT